MKLTSATYRSATAELSIRRHGRLNEVVVYVSNLADCKLLFQIDIKPRDAEVRMSTGTSADKWRGIAVSFYGEATAGYNPCCTNSELAELIDVISSLLD